MIKVLEDGESFSQALQEGTSSFHSKAQQLGVSPFAAHDVVRIYRAFARVVKQENISLQALQQQVASVNIPKLGLIAPVIEKEPSAWQYWLEMAENLPLQDLNGPVQQALKEAG